MALFKVYHATDEDELPLERKDGNSYVIADESKGLAQWKIDIGHGETDRWGIVSEGLLNENGQVMRASDLASEVYYGELLQEDWIKDNPTDEYYHQSVETLGIMCGANHETPPLISYRDLETRDQYYLLDHADASIENQEVVFYSKKVPGDMRVVICDYR